MRIIIFLLFLSFTATAQVSELTGTLNVLSATGTDPNFTVTGSFNSTSGFFATDVDTTMRVVARYVNGTTHRRNIYRITQRTAVGSNLTLTLVRVSGISTPFFPTGTHAIVAKTETGLLYDAPNVSQELESYINNYNLNKVAGETIDTAFYQNGAVKIITSDSTVYTAAIPVVTTSLNGLMPNTDYRRIKNVYTQITSNGQSVNINTDNGFNYYINIVGNNGNIGTPTGSFASGDKVNLFFYNQSASPKNVIFPGQFYKYADGSPVDTVTIQNADALGMSFVYTQGNIWYLVEGPGADAQPKQNQLQFIDESTALGAKGTVDTLKFTGSTVTASRVANTVTVNVAKTGIDTITSTDGTIDITEVSASEYNITIDPLATKTKIDTCYAVTISGGNSGSVLWVCANGPGVTASWLSGELTINSTATVKVKSADWRLVAADVQASADAGGATNWVRVRFQKTKGNSGYTDIRVPIVQKVALPGSGSLALSNSGSIDVDNNPALSVVECGANQIVIRTSGIVAGGNGYLLKFSGVH